MTIFKNDLLTYKFHQVAQHKGVSPLPHLVVLHNLRIVFSLVGLTWLLINIKWRIKSNVKKFQLVTTKTKIYKKEQYPIEESIKREM